MEITYQCLKLWAVFGWMPRGNDLFLYSLRHLFNSRVQNLDNLSVWCHEWIRGRGYGGRALPQPTQNQQGQHRILESTANKHDTNQVWLEGPGCCDTESLWTLLVSVAPIKDGRREVESVESIAVMGAMVIWMVCDKYSS